jgi:hypothetical protein
VPILAKLLGSIGTAIHIPIWDHTIILSLPFSWKAFYFSSVAFTIASFFYTFWCPPIIRDYKILSDFFAEGKGFRELREAMHLLVFSYDDDDSRRSLIRDFADSISYKFSRDQYISYLDYLSEIDDSLKEISEKKLPSCFSFMRETLDKANPVVRAICFVMYVVGFIFIAVVFFENFLYVLRLN